jgi:hypothetical protein
MAVTNYTSLPNAAVQAGGRPRGSTITALRDNPIAIAEGDSTAPVNAACWHPYDMVFANDGAIGRFYNGTVVASVTTPTMVAGYDYMFRGIGLSHNDGTPRSFLVNGVDFVGTTLANTTTLNFGFEIIAPAITDWPKRMWNSVYRTSIGGTNIGSPAETSTFGNNATGLTTFNFTWGAGSFDAGQLFMYRRRNYMP